MQEQDIVLLIRRRDERGAEFLLHRYEPLMRYVIRAILPDRQDQEECLSEAAMRIWDKIDSFQEERGSFRAWLTAITRNTALNKSRKNVRTECIADIPEDIPSTEPTPEEAVLKKEYREAVYTAIKQLSAREKSLFYRKYYYLQSTAQIASELGTTERSVEGRLYRLRRKLCKLLGGEYHG